MADPSAAAVSFDADVSVTVVVTREVKAGKEAPFEVRLHGVDACGLMGICPQPNTRNNGIWP